jgi:hypothetical protein
MAHPGVGGPGRSAAPLHQGGEAERLLLGPLLREGLVEEAALVGSDLARALDVRDDPRQDHVGERLVQDPLELAEGDRRRQRLGGVLDQHHRLSGGVG